MKICVDCAMLHANGDISGIENEVREAEVIAGLDEFPFLAVGDFWGFHREPCEACGTKLHGDRFGATAV